MQVSDAKLAKLVAEGHVVGKHPSECPKCQMAIQEICLSLSKELNLTKAGDSCGVPGAEAVWKKATWLSLGLFAVLLMLLAWLS